MCGQLITQTTRGGCDSDEFRINLQSKNKFIILIFNTTINNLEPATGMITSYFNPNALNLIFWIL